MTPLEWEKVTEIYHAASELGKDALPAFLDVACDGDTRLRREVESLLAAGSDAEDFIAEPAAGNFASDLFASNGPAVNEMIGHYRIVGKIGSGGMGEVFRAVDTRLGRDVAIKTLSSIYDGDPNFLKRFRNEARAAATLNHPNVAIVYSVDEHNGKPFIAMEHVDGKTLDHHFTDEGVDIARFSAWFTPVVDAISHAHDRGIVHRDIKPGNIMITTEGTPKVLDFGLACIASTVSLAQKVETNITQDGQIIGTPSYMSPEQAKGNDIDHRTDIFSLGVVMYEAATGVRPFNGQSNAETISNLLKSEPVPAAELRPSVPLPISKVISRCLKKDPSTRPQSMKKVRTMLAEAVSKSNGGISAGSFARRLYNETKPGSRWQKAAIAATVLLVAAAGYLYFSRLPSRSALNFATMTMRRLSQTNNVGYTQISPDGKSVVYATVEEDEARTLYFRRVDDLNALQLIKPIRASFWGGLAISEDSGQVFYLTAERSATYGSLYRVSTLGGPPRKLVEEANDVGGLSPDGQRILLVRYGDISKIIAVNTADGGDERVILAAPPESSAQTNFRDPQFAPDGKSIYYIRYERIDGIEWWTLGKLPVDGGAETQIRRQKERIGEIAVLRDNTGLLMTSTDPASNLQQLYHVSLPTGEKTRITNDLFFYFGISVDRDGKVIGTAQRIDENRVLVGDANDLTTLKPLSKEQNAHQNLDWTPDGRVVYDAYENNRAHIWIADADGKNVQLLTSANVDDSDPRVSPDGQYIVFSSERAELTQVWRMNIDGTNQVLLADVPEATQVPRFTADGQTVVFDWLRDRDRILGKVPIGGGQVEELKEFANVPLFNAVFWAMSPDGKFIAYSIRDEKANRTNIEVRYTDNSKPPILLKIWPSLIFKWSPDGRSLIYRERQFAYQPETVVLKVDIMTKESKVLYSAMPDSILDFAYSRDGRKVAVVKGGGTSNAVMLSALPEK